MVVIDAVVRLLDGAVGDDNSIRNESFSDGLLEYPHYTRPEEFRGMRVPEILLGGDHKKIEAWRQTAGAGPNATVAAGSDGKRTESQNEPNETGV